MMITMIMIIQHRGDDEVIMTGNKNASKASFSVKCLCELIKEMAIICSTCSGSMRGRSDKDWQKQEGHSTIKLLQHSQGMPSARKS